MASSPAERGQERKAGQGRRGKSASLRLFFRGLGSVFLSFPSTLRISKRQRASELAGS